jgi:hypothetical protein
MLKKFLPLVISGVVLVTLSACTTPDNKDDIKQDNNNGSVSFSAPVKEVTTLPYFNQEIEGLKLGVWGEGNQPDPYKEAPTETSTPSPSPTTGPQVGDEVELDPTPVEPVDPVLTEHPDTIIYFNINLNDTSTGCKMTGSISYLDTYLSSRGDNFNSFEQLYKLPPSSENPIIDATTTKINDVTYAVGKYTTPANWEDNAFHKTAVRVFSNPVERIEGNASVAGELGNWNSDTATGLPIVTIDFSCPNEADLTDARWEDGIQWYKLVFNKQNPYTPVDVKDLPSTDTTDNK